ncbi:DUF721 domain-containing protein [Bacteroidales bacterium OttesenSCG-928-L03]|nr:DUF721 domain-containing protein [Bacteroidales bacterium OttesenSCG-928-L03]
MRRKKTEQLGSILEGFFKENPSLADKMAENRLIQSWSKVLGSSVARYTSSLYIKNKCLYVKLTSSVVKNELMYCRANLIGNLNAEVGRTVIDDIVFL